MSSKPVSQLCLPPDGTLWDALQVIDKGACGIALLVGADQRLLGTVTDGDIRRALLAGASLQDRVEPHARRGFTSVNAVTPRAEVLDLMQARQIHQIPILDDEGRLKGLHLLHEIIGSAPRPNWAVIMAGGKGTRLGELTRATPKPMLKVAGRPILERLVLHLVGSGIRRVFISTNYLAGIIEDHFGDGARFGCAIEYLREEPGEPLGTGGSLALLPERPEQPVFVCNGDLVTQVDVAGMFGFHEEGGHAATIGVRGYSHEIPFGCLDVSEGRVTSIVEKPAISQLINAGIYILSPEVIGRVPRRHFPITELFEEALRLGDSVGAFEIADEWLDVGQREQLKQARGGAH
ncbi:MAG TPA: nucleotidyl transferase [Verrucomicrobiales bacterium]|nr:nucleotidyl transferase [Verrucomicrobiales bacterium]HCN76292.1 nucleotidyl transferase [Verrucomicrobiales bacterium]HRJ07676.1 nucleotidyltransferase family protein [Prosthecobacter sp.]HRK15081.1 nucleotidyltransferase family protein [Prosthecobacter sp.]